MAEVLSSGQILLRDKKLVQASCFLASLVDMNKRLEWSNSFAKESLRGNKAKLKDSSILLVLSQNCDIACPNDKIESAIELAVCKRIKSSSVYEGNSFVRSVRKLHFKLDDSWFEANVDYILTVDKTDLLNVINSLEIFEPKYLAEEYTLSVPAWRANRYLRSALPDNFNQKMSPVLKKHIPIIEKKAKATKGLFFSSFIRAIYIWVDSGEEKDNYSFDIFALLRDEANDRVTSEIQDAVEEFAENLSETAGYIDESDVYAGAESTITVGYLTKFVRLNLDYISLANCDSDTGPKLY